MSAIPRIGVACPSPGERAALLDWCEAGCFRPVPMIDPGSITRELDGDGFEALVIDADFAAAGETPQMLRALGRNRPILVVGDTGMPPVGGLGLRDATYLARPLTRELFLLAITLALAEGRPARRSPRRLVSRLQATVDGASARLIDVSYEGIRVELAALHRSSLPPVFNVKVPMFNVTVVGRRVWLNNALDQAAHRAFWCGVRLERNAERAVAAWRALVDNAPASTSISSEARNYL
jgi:hypothetical protein